MYFALHNDNIRAVLNRMKVNTVHVWRDSRDEMCKFSGQEAVGFSFDEEVQPIAREGCKLEPAWKTS